MLKHFVQIFMAFSFGPAAAEMSFVTVTRHLQAIQQMTNDQGQMTFSTGKAGNLEEYAACAVFNDFSVWRILFFQAGQRRQSCKLKQAKEANNKTYNR
jgi:hypothetical protein